GVVRDESGADVDRHQLVGVAVAADDHFGRAAADVEVHDALPGVGELYGARAVGRHCGFQVVAGADGDEAAGFFGKQVGDGPRVFAEQRDPCQDERASIHLVTREVRLRIL